MYKHLIPVILESDITVISAPSRAGKTTLVSKIDGTYTIAKTRRAIRGDKHLDLCDDDKIAIRSKNYGTIIFDEAHHFGDSEKSTLELIEGIKLAIENGKKIIFCSQSIGVFEKIDILKIAEDNKKKLITVNLDNWCVDLNHTTGYKVNFQKLN